jgi:predicted metal-dependent hydrolase
MLFMKNQPLHISPHFIELNTARSSYRLPIIIRKHPSSRRITLRFQPLQHSLMLTLPRYVSIKQGLHFVEQKRRWIEQQIDETMQHFPFEEGRMVPMLGRQYRICHVGGRGVVRIEDDAMLVPGDIEFLPRRVRDWLKQEARTQMTLRAKSKALQIDAQMRGVTVRDTTSRWGSCSHSGHLSFSWRLLLAPEEVFDYVVSHEVSHLKEFNHSATFWAIVAQLCPGYKDAQQWLVANGQSLYGYGSNIRD